MLTIQNKGVSDKPSGLLVYSLDQGIVFNKGEGDCKATIHHLSTREGRHLKSTVEKAIEYIKETSHCKAIKIRLTASTQDPETAFFRKYRKKLLLTLKENQFKKVVKDISETYLFFEKNLYEIEEDKRTEEDKVTFREPCYIFFSTVAALG